MAQPVDVLQQGEVFAAVDPVEDVAVADIGWGVGEGDTTQGEWGAGSPVAGGWGGASPVEGGWGAASPFGDGLGEASPVAGWGNSEDGPPNDPDGPADAVEVSAENVEALAQEAVEPVVIGVGDVTNGRQLPIELLALIIVSLLPAIDDVWVHNGWDRTTLSCFVTVFSVSRAWYWCTRSWPVVWAALLAFAPDWETWLEWRARAGDQPLRLMYKGRAEDVQHWEELDAALPMAAAVYAGPWTPYRDWVSILVDVGYMEHLEALYVLPDNESIPEGELALQDTGLDTPKLWFCSINFPVRFSAQRLTHLSVSNCSDEQLRTMLAPLDALERLELYEPRTNHAVDWTWVLSAGTWLRLRTLRVRVRRITSIALPEGCVAIPMPKLRELDTSGPVLILAPSATDMTVLHISSKDLIRMLRGMPSLHNLRIRTLPSQWADDVGPELPLEAADLIGLESVTVETPLSHNVLDLVRALRTPNATRFIIPCDVSVRRQPAALPAVVNLMQSALPDTATHVYATVASAERLLFNAGYNDLSAELWHTMFAIGGDQEEEGWAIQSLKDASRAMLARVSATMEAPAEAHDGVRLQSALCTIFDTMSLRLDDAEVEVVISVLEGLTAFQLCIRQAEQLEREVVCSMWAPHAHGQVRRRETDPSNSLAYGAARVLQSLQFLPVTALRVNNAGEDPLRPAWGSTEFRPDDRDVLARSVFHYAGVAELTIDLKESYPHPGMGILSIIGCAGSLPALASLRVLGPARDQSERHPKQCQPWFDALLIAVTARVQGGGTKLRASIEGRFCLARTWVVHMQGELLDLVLDVPCQVRVGEDCPACAQIGHYM